jgi:hypothetical protein
VEEVGSVPVHLDAGLGFGLTVSIPTDVRAPIEDQYAQAHLGGAPFRDRQPEEAGTDND